MSSAQVLRVAIVEAAHATRAEVGESARADRGDGVGKAACAVPDHVVVAAV